MKLLTHFRDSSQSPSSNVKNSWKPSSVSPNDAERPLSPARSKSDLGNIRGRISGPIPISSPLDDDFLVRHQSQENGAVSTLASQSQALDLEPVEKGLPNTSPSTPKPDKNVSHVSRSSPEAVQNTQRALHMRSQSSPIGAGGPRTGNAQKHATIPNVRQSTFSANTSSSKNLPQRKKSTLRGAIGRLFGRKKKNIGEAASSSDGSQRPTPDSWTRQHRSTTITTPIAEDPAAEQRKSTPFTHDDYGRALRSHTVEDEDRSAIERSRTLVHLDSNFSRRRPGAFGMLSIRERGAVNGELGGLTPRPASVHARLSSSQEFTDENADENPEEIGRAITSDYSGLKRRSRSLSAMAGGSRGNPEGRRSLSTEIRYWRQSYDPQYKSPVDSSHNLETEENDVVRVEDAVEQVDITVPVSPLQPFSFGDIASMNQMAGMKITQAADMEARLGSLEERVKHLEKMLKGPHVPVPGYGRMPHDQEPPNPRSIPNAAPPISYKISTGTTKRPTTPSFDATVQYSNHPDTRHSRASSHSSLDFTYAQPSMSRVLQTDKRAQSSTPIRGAASLPSLTRELSRPLTVEHYTTLIALLETERSARQVLEAKVKTLGYQVSIMAKSSNGPQQSRRLSKETSTFDFDDEADEVDDTPTKSLQSTDQRLIVTQDFGTDPCIRNDDDDDSTSYASSANGEMDMDGTNYKKATRTLSLSQLTLKRPVPRSATEPLPNVI